MTGVLFVCRANLCRSPIGAALLQARGAAVAANVLARSAGLVGAGDEQPGPDLVRAARAVGVDLAAHRSHRLRVADTRAADLVLTMEHHQIGDVLQIAPDAWPRTFTLKEIVRRAAQVGPRSDGEPLDAWIRRLHAGRTLIGVVGAWQDDVPDPALDPDADLWAVIDELEALIARFTAAAWPAATRSPATARGRS